MMAAGIAEEVLFPDDFRRDRRVVVSGLIILTAMCWAILVHHVLTIHGAPLHTTHQPGMSPHTLSGGPGGLLWACVLWITMMTGMMVPSAIPAMVRFSAAERLRFPDRSPHRSTLLFLGGFLLVWSVFSVLLAGVEWGLFQAGWLVGMSGKTTPMIGGVLLIGAGLFQWSSIKQICLVECRHPVCFPAHRGETAWHGAFALGYRHGGACLTSCWALMALMFVLGTMNLWWMMVLAALVLVEKVAPPEWQVHRIGGGLFLIWGIGLLL